MKVISLFMVASMPIIKVLLITAIGLFLAFDTVDILGANARKHLNKVVFFVFNPALVGSNLGKTVTLESFLKLWFMPVNVLIAFLLGSALGWVLVKLTNAPKHLKGLIIGACSAGNLGNMIIIIIPAICKEKGSPFGAPDVCHTYGMAYASLSMALGAIFLWSYVYNIVRISSKDTTEIAAGDDESNGDASVEYIREPLLPSTDSSTMHSVDQIPLLSGIKDRFRKFSKMINLKSVLAPSTSGAIVGFAIGVIGPIRKLLIGNDAPLHVIEDTAYLLGEAAIPTTTLILGANLLRGLKGSGIQLRIVFGIVVVRYIFLPLFGILVIKGAIHFGLLPFDPLFQFVLLIQYAVPPAMNIGTITQLFGTGQSECSVIMLWTYALASVALTFWCTFFLWLVAS
ncbi:protein PIN-LIKES 3-like [Silene latifolia]|uniref:protein PIN-LIKES 3-like n=1 Tax=Silene latifolia TaxID=37657 RepID=UPI003D77AFE5